MADEIKKEETTQVTQEFSTSINESKIRKIKEPDFSNEVIIDRVHLLPKPVYEQHRAMIKKTFGEDIKEEEIARRINNLVIRDAVFDRAMKIIVPCYEINIEQKDIENFANMLRKIQPGLVNTPKEYVETLARRSIEKELIFIVLAKEWKMEVTDDEARKVLMDYYKATNDSVRDKLNDPDELNKIKTTLLEQKIAQRICESLKCKIDWEAINKHANEDRARMQEYIQKMQAQAQQTKESQPAKPEEKK